MDFLKCREILLKESELVQKISCLQKLIWEAVSNRDWTDFEAHFLALNRMGDAFSIMEDERKKLFHYNQGELNDSSGFYAWIARFPHEQRSELAEIFRNLKLETLKLKISNETMLKYIAESRAAIAGFFEIAFPDRGGKIYTPYGKPVSHDMRSMVLNRIF